MNCHWKLKLQLLVIACKVYIISSSCTLLSILELFVLFTWLLETQEMKYKYLLLYLVLLPESLCAIFMITHATVPIDFPWQEPQHFITHNKKMTKPPTVNTCLPNFSITVSREYTFVQDEIKVGLIPKDNCWYLPSQRFSKWKMHLCQWDWDSKTSFAPWNYLASQWVARDVAPHGMLIS